MVDPTAPPTAYGVRLVPLPLREAAEGDQAHQRHDQPDPEAPHDHQDNPHDHQDPAETDPAGVSARATFRRHSLSSTTPPSDQEASQSSHAGRRAPPTRVNPGSRRANHASPDCLEVRALSPSHRPLAP